MLAYALNIKMDPYCQWVYFCYVSYIYNVFVKTAVISKFKKVAFQK